MKNLKEVSLLEEQTVVYALPDRGAVFLLTPSAKGPGHSAGEIAKDPALIKGQVLGRLKVVQQLHPELPPDDYAITLAPNGTNPQFLCTLLRAHKPKGGFDVDAPVFGEGQFLTHDSHKPEHIRERALALGRLGIKGVRIELGWAEGKPGTYDNDFKFLHQDILFFALLRNYKKFPGRCR